jgi:hypothetical protein
MEGLLHGGEVLGGWTNSFSGFIPFLLEEVLLEGIEDMIDNGVEVKQAVKD